MSVASGGAPDAQATFAATLVDEWVRGGVTEAVVCPGSRSTPLALALAARPELSIHVRLDERSAGFFALGLGLESGRPAVVCVTSGTAAAELHASVVEADLARVPVLLCTADRPPVLHQVGAPQTIEQVGLFGGAVRWALAPGPARAEEAPTWRSLAARALAEAVAGPSGPGPVHLNLAFVEPLVAVPGPLPDGRPDGRSWHRVERAAGGPVPFELPEGRGVLVAGAGCGPADAVLALGRALGWPVLADPRSRCRVDDPLVVAAADGILRPAVVRRALAPDVVVVLGAPPTSRAQATFVAEAAAAGAEVLAVDPAWAWADPDRLVTRHLAMEPERLLAAAGQARAADPAWSARWAAAEQAAQHAVARTLAGQGRPGGLSEPELARTVLEAVATDTTVVVSSSMPVRDLEWYGPTRPGPPRVLANRGANGIDGVTSTALGVAASGGGPVVALLGDLAFLHDVSGLVRLAGGDDELACTLVVVDNGGGGIFSFLPQATTVPEHRFEALFGTPPKSEVAAVAAGFGWPVATASSAAELRQALGSPPKGCSVLHVPVPGRAANEALHRQLADAVGSAVAAALSL